MRSRPDYLKTMKVSRRETNFITGATEKVTKKLNHLDPRSFLVENYQIIDGNADHICQGQGLNSTHTKIRPRSDSSL